MEGSLRRTDGFLIGGGRISSELSFWRLRSSEGGDPSLENMLGKGGGGEGRRRGSGREGVDQTTKNWCVISAYRNLTVYPGLYSKQKRQRHTRKEQQPKKQPTKKKRGKESGEIFFF